MLIFWWEGICVGGFSDVERIIHNVGNIVMTKDPFRRHFDDVEFYRPQEDC